MVRLQVGVKVRGIAAAHLPVDDGPGPEVAAAVRHVGLRQRQEAGPRGAVQAQHVLQPVHRPLQPHTEAEGQGWGQDQGQSVPTDRPQSRKRAV